MESKKRTALQGLLLAVSAVMIFYGAYRGEVSVVFTKAVNVCLECIGLG